MGRIGCPDAFRDRSATISGVPVFYDFDKANAKLPEVRETLLRLRAQRGEIVAMRDRIVELNAPALAGAAAAFSGAGTAEVTEETGRLRMKMQGLGRSGYAGVSAKSGSSGGTRPRRGSTAGTG
jgi:hypothetical protein